MQYGHFDDERREYVIDRVDLPVSWTNYLGVEDTCVVVNHTAGGYMFYKTPEYHRVTRFRGNAVPMDRPGHYVYLRDAESGDYWSISWQPVGKPLDEANYTCRHGLSYSVYECEYQKIKASQKLFVPRGDDLEIWDVKIKNEGDKPRKLQVFSYCEFSFHHIMIDNQNFQMSMYCAGSDYEDGIIQYDLFYEEFGYQYFTMSEEPDGGEGTVYEHMMRILDFSDRQVGENGICKGLRADWNDCLNLGGGESAMVSFLHYWAMENFLEVAEYLGRDGDVKKYREMADQVYVSQWHLSKLLNRYLGQSFSEILNDVRIEKAKKLLENSSLRYSCGDCDAVFFLLYVLTNNII